MMVGNILKQTMFKTENGDDWERLASFMSSNISRHTRTALTASALVPPQPGAQAFAASTIASTRRSRMGAQWLLRVCPITMKSPDGSKSWW